jgi:hypothetical protein
LPNDGTLPLVFYGYHLGVEAIVETIKVLGSGGGKPKLLGEGKTGKNIFCFVL